MKAVRIPLAGERGAGLSILIDEADRELVTQFTWYVLLCTPLTYARTCHGLQVHRLLMDPLPGLVVDHVNHDGLDNRRSNLRVVTQSLNNANSRKQRRATTSRYKGVYRRADIVGAGCWYARIKVDGHTRGLGLHASEVEAARAYNRAAVEAWGPHAFLNVIEETQDARR